MKLYNYKLEDDSKNKITIIRNTESQYTSRWHPNIKIILNWEIIPTSQPQDTLWVPILLILTFWRAWRQLRRWLWPHAAGTAHSSSRPAAWAAPLSSCPGDLLPWSWPEPQQMDAHILMAALHLNTDRNTKSAPCLPTQLADITRRLALHVRDEHD